MLSADNFHPVVLFDGVCNYCNAMVNLAIRNDKQARLRFAPLQSVIGKQLKNRYAIPDAVDSVVFIDNNRAYTHAAAVFHIAKYLSYPVKVLYTLRIIPSFISNAVYRWIAKNRYQWFGKKDACMIPSAEVRRRFLE